MKNSARFRFTAALAAAAGLFTALPATAVIGGQADCVDSALTRSNSGYKDCRKFNPGMVTGSQDDIDDLVFSFSSITRGGTFTFAGKSNDANGGPFQSDPGSVSAGVLQFDFPVNGFFALALQSADTNFYSYYLFDGAAFGGAAPLIAFDTFGIGNANRGNVPLANLLFVGLFIQPSGPGSAVPEPAGAALALAALGALVLTKRRR